MYPFILQEVFGYLLPTYDLLLLVGVFCMIGYVIYRFEKVYGYTKQQTNRLLVLIVVSLLSALAISFVVDGIFHSIKEGELEFGSLNFLSGLVGGFATFLLLLKYFYKEERNTRQIINTIITGVVLAHAIGRIGCFFAGCCFGIPTDSYLGIMFPHGHSHIAYPGEAVLPTMLFESAFLFLLFFLLHKVDKLKGRELETYTIGYGMWRFGLEFLRGDDRGVLLSLFETKYNVFPTPAQFISLLMIGLGVYLLNQTRQKNKDVSY